MAFQIARTYTGKKFTKFPPDKFRADAGWYLEGKFVPSWEIDSAKIPTMHNFLQKKHGVRATFYLYK